MDLNEPIETGTDRLLAGVRDGIGTITLNDPDRHNTISADMARALPGAIGALVDHLDVRVIVLRGAGDRAFASGADIGEQSARSDAGGHRESSMFGGIGGDILLATDKPVVALIRGWCLGGGMMLALCADLRIATDDARFSIPASRLGLAAPPQVVDMLTGIVGPTVAAELLFLGDRIDANRAAELNIVNRVVPADAFDDAAEALLAGLVARAPLSIRAAKRAIARHVGLTAVTDDEVDAAVADAFASEDAREGTAAFMEKRDPEFRGR